MALEDKCLKIRLQLLTDPLFYVSGKHDPGHLVRKSISRELSTDLSNWVNMKGVFETPFDARATELEGHPPTFIHLSQNSDIHCELEYYCTRLISTGNLVSYINIDDTCKALNHS